MVREVTKTYYVGANGVEYSSKKEAEESFLIERLSKVFNKKYKDYSFLVSEAIVDNRDSILKVLQNYGERTE